MSNAIIDRTLLKLASIAETEQQANRSYGRQLKQARDRVAELERYLSDAYAAIGGYDEALEKSTEREGKLQDEVDALRGQVILLQDHVDEGDKPVIAANTGPARYYELVEGDQE